MANRNIRWQQFPLLRPVIAMVTGGFLYSSCALFQLSALHWVCLWLMLIIGLFLQKLWPVILYSTFLFLGYYHMQERDVSFHHYPILSAQQKQDISLYVDRCSWDSKNERYKIYGRSYISACEKPIPVYAWYPDAKPLQKGDRILFIGSFRNTMPSPFRQGFDFSAFLQKRKTVYTVWIDPEKVIKTLTETNAEKKFWQRWRLNSLSQLEKKLSTESYGIYAAVLYGASGELKSDIRNKFAELGIAHILAVSGMHVGILVSVLSSLIHLFYKRGPYKRLLMFIMITAGCFSYTVLCDFMPSAVRASLMASMYFLARALHCDQSGLNSLAFSALALFIWDPYVIFDLGAQLSFTAMLGIFLLYPPIQEWCRWKIPLPEQVSSLLSLSFAAQLSLMPLLLYYFGQLPLLFWLFGIPAAYFAIFIFCSGWLFVLLSALIPAWNQAGQVLSGVVDFCIHFVEKAADQGNLLLKVFYFDEISMLLMALIVIQVGVWMYQTSKRSRIFNLKMISLWICCFIWIQTAREQDVLIEAFQARYQDIVLIKLKERAYTLSEDVITEYDEEAIRASFPIDSLHSMKLGQRTAGTFLHLNTPNE